MKEIVSDLFDPTSAIGLIMISITAGLVVIFVGWILKNFRNRKNNNKTSHIIIGNDNIQISDSENIKIEEK